MIAYSSLGKKNKPEAEKIVKTHSIENLRWVAIGKMANKIIKHLKT